MGWTSPKNYVIVYLWMKVGKIYDAKGISVKYIK